MSKRKIILLLIALLIFSSLGAYFFVKQKSGADVAQAETGTLSGTVTEVETGLPIAGAELWLSNPAALGREKVVITTDENGEFVKEGLKAAGDYQIKVASIESWDPKFLETVSAIFSIRENQLTEINFYLSKSPDYQEKTKIELIEGLKIDNDDYYSSQELPLANIAIGSVEGINAERFYEIQRKLNEKSFWRLATKGQKEQVISDLIGIYPELQKLKELEEQSNWFLIPESVPVVNPWANDYVDDGQQPPGDQLPFLLSVDKANAEELKIDPKNRQWRDVMVSLVREKDLQINETKRAANAVAGRTKYPLPPVGYVLPSTFMYDMDQLMKKVGSYDHFIRLWEAYFNYDVCLHVQDIYNKSKWADYNLNTKQWTNDYNLALFYNIYAPQFKHLYRNKEFTEGEKAYIRAMTQNYCNYQLATRANFRAAVKWSGEQVFLFFGGGIIAKVKPGLVARIGAWIERLLPGAPRTQRVVSGGAKVAIEVAEAGGVIEYVIIKGLGKVGIVATKMFGKSIAKNAVRLRQIALEDLRTALESFWDSPIGKEQRRIYGDQAVKEKLLKLISNTEFNAEDFIGEGLSGAQAYAWVSSGKTAIGDHALINIFNVITGATRHGRTELGDVFVHEYYHHMLNKLNSTAQAVGAGWRSGSYNTIEEGFVEFFTRKTLPNLYWPNNVNLGAYLSEREVIETLFERYQKLYSKPHDEALAEFYRTVETDGPRKLNEYFRIGNEAYFDVIDYLGVLMKQGKYNEAKQFIQTLQKAK